MKHKEAYHEAHDKAAQLKEGRALSQPTLKQVFDNTTKWTPTKERPLSPETLTQAEAWLREEEERIPPEYNTSRNRQR